MRFGYVFDSNLKIAMKFALFKLGRVWGSLFHVDEVALLPSLQDGSLHGTYLPSKLGAS